MVSSFALLLFRSVPDSQVWILAVRPEIPCLSEGGAVHQEVFRRVWLTASVPTLGLPAHRERRRWPGLGRAARNCDIRCTRLVARLRRGESLSTTPRCLPQRRIWGIRRHRCNSPCTTRSLSRFSPCLSCLPYPYLNARIERQRASNSQDWPRVTEGVGVLWDARGEPSVAIGGELVCSGLLRG